VFHTVTVDDTSDARDILPNLTVHIGLTGQVLPNITVRLVEVLPNQPVSLPLPLTTRQTPPVLPNLSVHIGLTGQVLPNITVRLVEVLPNQPVSYRCP